MSFILLDNSLEPGGRSYLFNMPEEIVRADHASDIPAALDRLAAAQSEGLYAAGFFAYEAGLCFEPRLLPLLPENAGAPLLWFGLFKERQELDAASVESWLSARQTSDYRLIDLQPTVDPETYEKKIAKTLDYIASGDIYQLNLTFKAKFAFSGDALALYRDLRRKQKVAYGAVIAAPDFHILSLSPELFLRVKDGHALTRPMKGTAPRGVNAAEDQKLSGWLASDVKSRAENLMIVDLMRNDLARIAEIGSVEVSDLFTVETFQTVLQMTSGVTATLKPDVDLPHLLKAIFPPGSITGAPKMRAIEIIHELEDEPRGVYTGAIGMIEPNGDCVFNVAIRTLMLDGKGRGEIGIGSGIVQDSNAASEYEECLLKMRFLTTPVPDFKLIETLRWDKFSGFALLDRHIERLTASAKHFGFICNPEAARLALEQHVATLIKPGSHRVRLTLDERGRIEVTSTPFDTETGIWRFVIAPMRMNSRNIFLYHKTTQRDFYDDERKRLAAKCGCDEVIFLNERGELTEGSFTTLFIEKGGQLLTPALASGLLPGTLRAELLDSGKAHEAILTLRDLAEADAIWLGNSVRGLIRAAPADAFIIEASATKMRRDSQAARLAAGT